MVNRDIGFSLWLDFVERDYLKNEFSSLIEKGSSLNLKEDLIRASYPIFELLFTSICDLNTNVNSRRYIVLNCKVKEYSVQN